MLSKIQKPDQSVLPVKLRFFEGLRKPLFFIIKVSETNHRCNCSLSEGEEYRKENDETVYFAVQLSCSPI